MRVFVFFSGNNTLNFSVRSSKNIEESEVQSTILSIRLQNILKISLISGFGRYSQHLRAFLSLCSKVYSQSIYPISDYQKLFWSTCVHYLLECFVKFHYSWYLTHILCWMWTFQSETELDWIVNPTVQHEYYPLRLILRTFFHNF